MKYDCVVLTYTVKHRKTYDVLCMLKAKGYNKVLVFAVPMKYKKTYIPLYEHRPKVNNNIETIDMCINFGYDYVESDGTYENIVVDKEIPILYCGAGILPDDFINSHLVINAHPGYIPLARGLDAFKWAIVDNLPIGVTTHIIGDEVDAGEIIERREIEISKNDTFHAVAQRVYENEVTMLVDALEKLDEEHEYIAAGDNVLHKRMPEDIERGLMEAFNRRLI